MRWTMMLAAALTAVAATAAAAAEPAVKADAPAEKPEKPICKREAPIGSLVASKRTCHSAAEWRRIREDAQEQTGRMQQSGNGSTPQ